MSKRSLRRQARRLDAEAAAHFGEKSAHEEGAQRHNVAAISQFAYDQAHNLGNRLIAVTFCLKHLRGQQRNKELEEMAEQGFRDAEQGLDAMRQYTRAMRVLQKAKIKPE